MSKVERLATLTSDSRRMNVSCSAFSVQFTATVGNAFTLVTDTGQIFAFYRYQNTAANGDTWTVPFAIDAGVYTISILGMTNNAYGKQDVYIDGNLVGTLDWYSAGLTYNVIQTISGVAISRGRHVLKSVINGKNGSSSNYALLTTYLWIQ